MSNPIDDADALGEILANSVRDAKQSTTAGTSLEDDPAGISSAEAEESYEVQVAKLVAEIVQDEDASLGINLSPDDPHRLARLLLATHYLHDDRPMLVCQGKRFLAWDGQYQDVTDDIGHAISTVLHAEFHRLNRRALAVHDAAIRAKGDAARARAAQGAPPVGTDQHSRVEAPPRAMHATTRKIADVRVALASLVKVPAALTMPNWIDESGYPEPGPFPARDAIPMANAIIHLADPRTVRIEPTPRLFTMASLPYDYDPDAPVPTTWLDFLDEILPGDCEAQAMLQEWCGYCLVHDTSHQKILTIIGPPRSGKGTIGRVLAGLLGPGAVGTSFATLGERFGLQELVDKKVAVVGDARLSGRSDQAVIVARLLSISGEDPIDADRKGIAPWHGTMTTRLMLISNEIPSLRDASMALASRLLMLRLIASWQGREDETLTARILAERPGLLNWALDGLRRLRERGSFVQAESGRPLLDVARAVASEVGLFVAERCVVGGCQSVRGTDLYSAFLAWSRSQGRTHFPDHSRFGRDLRAVCPAIERVQRPDPTGGSARSYYYDGIALQSSQAPDDGPSPAATVSVPADE